MGFRPIFKLRARAVHLVPMSIRGTRSLSRSGVDPHESLPLKEHALIVVSKDKD